MNNSKTAILIISLFRICLALFFLISAYSEIGPFATAVMAFLFFHAELTSMNLRNQMRWNFKNGK